MATEETQKTKLEEIEERRAKRKAKAQEARAEQEAIDLEAIDKIEVEKGLDLKTLRLNITGTGLPVLVAIKAPDETYYKRFKQRVRRADGNAEKRGDAQEELAASCWVYPDDEQVRKSVTSAAPGTLMSIFVEAIKLAELASEAEGKA